MSVQPKALFLADVIESDPTSAAHHDEAAAELRRLYAENERIGPLAERVLELKAQRDALLEALKSTGLFLHHCWCDVQMNDYSFEKLNQQMAVVDAAIKAVEEEA